MATTEKTLNLAERLHELADRMSGLPPEKQEELLKEVLEEVEKDVRRRIQPPIDWVAVLDRLIKLADRYLEIRGGAPGST
jgi:adenylate kinase